MIDIGERKRKEQIERQQREWDTTEHSFAGQTMTGKEWAEFAESLKEGSKGQSWLIEYLMTKQGMTQDEATQYAHDMKDAADGMATPHPTEEQEAAKHRIEANPKSDEIVHDYKVAQDQNFPPVSEKTAHLTNADQTVSVAARSTGLYEEFPTAPNLIEHHEAALAAKEPLDAAKPTQVAAAVPPPAASAGLDV